VVQHDAVAGQLVDQHQQLVERFGKGRRVEQLRADMAVDAADVDVRQGGGLSVERPRFVVGDAELVFLEAGRDVGVCAGVDVGIDAQADRRASSRALPATALRRSSSGADSTLKHRMPVFSASSISAAVLPTPEKTIFAGIGAGGEDALEFTCRDDVEAGATARQDVEHGEVGVGLDGVADERVEPGQFVLELVESALQRLPRVDPARRAKLACNVAERHRLGVQHAVAGVEWRQWGQRIGRHLLGFSALAGTVLESSAAAAGLGGGVMATGCGGAASVILGCRSRRAWWLPAKPAQDNAA
jgi:hypothetical protein